MSDQFMWQPACSHEALKARAELYARVRAFFLERNVLEVDTPILSRAGSTDPFLDSLCVKEQQALFLQTSPEFAMKRLLASGSGDIYQLCKCFRRNETGVRHNQEFTMLEWYRIGYSLSELMDEIAELVCGVLELPAYEVLSYRQVFENYLSINPFSSSIQELKKACQQETGYEGEELDRDGCLNLLLSHCIEPKLGFDRPCFLTDYPASQASLARIENDKDGYPVGKRAELYVRGIELANAYDELTDAKEQEKRFDEDRVLRAKLGFSNVPKDKHLLDALESGMPASAGVALGIDRLLMLQLGSESLSDVLGFPDDRA